MLKKSSFLDEVHIDTIVIFLPLSSICIECVHLNVRPVAKLMVNLCQYIFRKSSSFYCG